MKIAFFHNLPPGGAKRVAYQQVKHLGAKHKVHLFNLTTTNESFLDIRKIAASTKTYPFKQSKLRIVRDIQTFFSLKTTHKKIADHINSNNFDIALIHPDKHTQAPFILRFLKIPSLYYCHEWLRIAYEKEFAFNEQVSIHKKLYEHITRKIRKQIDKKNTQSATKILVNSKHTEKNLKKAYQKNSEVCYPGVDTKVFSPKKVKKTNKPLYASNHGPKPSITDTQLAKEYSKHLATISFQKNEPFGLIPLESMATETPVIALDSGGYKETVIDKKTGYLVENIKEQNKKITFLSKNPSHAKKMGKAGRKHVKENFTWKQHMNILDKEIKNL